jgi:peptidoglycan/LPS O-acetylase OafA/YrhL
MTTVHFKSFLHTRALRWLGKVSFSLYLVHGVVLYALASVFWMQSRHHVLLLSGGIVLSLFLSEYLYEWIERPSILLGRRLTRRAV